MNNSKRLFMMAGAAVLLVSLMINAFLSYSSFEGTTRKALYSRFQITAGDIQRQIQRGLNLGRPLSRFRGLQELLEAGLMEETSFQSGAVFDLNQGILAQTSQGDLPWSDEFSETNLEIREYSQGPVLVRPLLSHGTQVVGFLVYKIHPNFLEAPLTEMINQLWLPYLSATLVSLLIFFLGSWLIGVYVPETQEKLRFWIQRSFLIIVLLAFQGVLSFSAAPVLQTGFLNAFSRSMEQLARIVSDEILQARRYEIPLERIKNADILLETKLKGQREAEALAILDDRGMVLYQAQTGSRFSILTGEAAPVWVSELSPYGLSLPLLGGGAVSLRVNRGRIAQEINSLNLDILTVLVVVVVFSLELLRGTDLVPLKKGRNQELRGRLSLIRILGFLFFFAALMPVSFLPQLFQGYALDSALTSLFSPDTLAGWPISSYLLGITIFIPLVGLLSNRFSVRSLFVLSGALFIFGTLGTIMAIDLTWMILARLLTGMGYGGVIINATSLIVQNTEPDQRSTGFGTWSAGYAAATICGIAFGGVVVNRMGTGIALGVSLVLALLFILTVYGFVAEKKPEAEKRLKAKWSDLFLVLRNPSFFASLLFASLPLQLAYIGLFQYAFPLHMTNLGLSESDIGRVLTIYGLLALATPLVSRFSDAVKKDKTFIVLGNLITGVVLLLFFSSDALWVLIGAVLAIGVGSMMVDAVNESYLTKIPEAQQIGEARLLSIYATYEKVIAVLVPLFSAIVISLWGFSFSIGLFGVITLVGVLLFLLLTSHAKPRHQVGAQS